MHEISNKEKERHSKTRYLQLKKIKCSQYLRDPRLSSSEVELLFKLRCRMFPVKNNFKEKFSNDLFCDLCRIEADDQEHLLNCKILKNSNPEIFAQNTVKYSDIFAKTDKQVIAAKMLFKIAACRDSLLESIGKSLF